MSAPACHCGLVMTQGANNDRLAVTIVLRVAIITTSLAGAAVMFAIITSGSSPRTGSYYTVQTFPSLAGKLGLAFVTITWTSVVLSFLCYMSWRVRSFSTPAASSATYAIPGGPPRPNSRREALD
jgi:hypothetical protein